MQVYYKNTIYNIITLITDLFFSFKYLFYKDTSYYLKNTLALLNYNKFFKNNLGRSIQF